MAAVTTTESMSNSILCASPAKVGLFCNSIGSLMILRYVMQMFSFFYPLMIDADGLHSFIHSFIDSLTNSLQAPAHYLTTYKPILDHDGLYRSKLELHFNATQDYFQHDNLRLRCAATLTLIYELKAVEYLIDGSKKPKGASKRFTNGEYNNLFMFCIHTMHVCLYGEHCFF